MLHRLLFALLILLAAGCSGLVADDGGATDGELDLRQNSFDGPVLLNGTWLAQSDPDSAAAVKYALEEPGWRPVQVPGRFTDQGYPDEGLVWYRLHLRLPPDAPALNGYLKYARNASSLYATTSDGTVVPLGNSGWPGPNSESTTSSRRPTSFNLPSDSSLVLSWQVANYDYHRGGVPNSLIIGTPDVMHRWLFRAEMQTLLIAGIYLMLTLFFAAYWIGDRRDAAALTVSLLALVTMVRAVVVEGHFELLLGDAMTFDTRIRIEAITFFILPGLTLLSMWSLYPKEYLPLRIGRFSWSPPPFFDRSDLRRDTVVEKPLLSRPWRRVNSFVLVSLGLVGGVFSLVAVVANTSLITHLLTTFRLLTLSMMVLMPWVLVQIVERRRPLAPITLTAFLTILVTTVHDILLSEGVLSSGVFLAPYGLLTFLLLQGLVVIRRGSRNAHLVQNHAQILEEEVERQTRELKRAIVASEAANVAKTQFLNAISHEIRTPLTSIIGFTQILEEELPQDDRKHTLEFVHLIRDSGDRLLRLVNDLLDLAKIETGKLDLEIRDVSLSHVIQDVVRQSFPFARSKELDLEVDQTVDAFVVRADPMRLHQVLQNLVTNGLKFTDQGGVYISAERSTMEGFDDEGRPAVAVRVRDTGAGMSREFLPHVFDRFTQELRGGHAAVRGTGLGLALSRELVLRMNGRVDVESVLGQGSVFTVWLPLTPTSPTMPLEPGRAAGCVVWRRGVGFGSASHPR